MTPDAFLDEDNWAGSYYELAIQLGHRDDDDERLIGALRAMWHHPSLHGCYLDRFADPAPQHRLTPTDLDLPDSTPVYGWANPPGRPTVVCATWVIREDFGPGDDWLDLVLPTGALERRHANRQRSTPLPANDVVRTVEQTPASTGELCLAPTMQPAPRDVAARSTRLSSLRMNPGTTPLAAMRLGTGLDVIDLPRSACRDSCPGSTL